MSEDLTKEMKKHYDIINSSNYNAKMIHYFTQQYCHCFTSFLIKQFNVESVVLFYKKESGQILHSAILFDNFMIIDAFGKRSLTVVKEYYNFIIQDFLNQKDECEIQIINKEHFNPNDFFDGQIEEDIVFSKSKEWFDFLNQNKYI